MRARVSHAALTALALAAGTAWAQGGEHERFSDSGIQGPAYAEILAGMELLAARAGGWATVHEYGRSVGGKPLKAVRIQNPAAASAVSTGTRRVAAFISGATHGNEYLGIEDRLPAWFVDNRDGSPGLMRFLAAGGVLYVVPIVNPDGYERRVRENNRNVDLNRDFDLLPANEPKFNEPESRALAMWLDGDLAASGARLAVSVDYHCCNGSLLFPWSWTRDAIPGDDFAAHEEIARLMQQDIDPTYVYGSTADVLGYLGRGTSKDYWYARHQALAFTYEGEYRTENQKFAKHTVWWDHVLAQVAD